MSEQKNEKSYIFLDESGKPEVFSRKGVNLVSAGTASKFLVIAAAKTNDHLGLQQAVTSCRLEILKDNSLSQKFSPAYSLDSFHAQTDYPEVKQRFYEWIKNCPIDIKICAIVAEKLKAYPQLQRDSARLYATVSGQLLKRFLHNSEFNEVIFSRRDASLKARERLQLVVDTLRTNFASEHNFDLSTSVAYHHNPHYSHGGLQIADYIAYAVFQVFEKGNKMWWNIIKDKVGYVQDIFNKKSYSQGNPL